MFSLEALDANNGDCLFLHVGPVNSPKLIIIDGGPEHSGVSTFSTAIEPRLEEISQLRNVALPLPVELLMVSHIDDDHIGGVIRLMKRAKPGASQLVDITAIWHNSFDDFLDTDELDALAKFGKTSGSAAANFDEHLLAMAAGVKQGLEVRDRAADLGITPNAGTASGFMAAGDQFTTGGATFRILGPAKVELESLQAKFDAENPNAASLSASERRSALAAFTDNSVANLSSIVAFVERGGKTMLLTGDARGDKILQGLQAAGLLTNGEIKVDLLKVPHHGSDRNVSTEFFRKVIAKHYVFSGDGAHGNPDTATLQMIAAARGADKYTMWFTHELTNIKKFAKQDRANNTRKYDIMFRGSGATSLWVDLEEDLDF